jgi:hypothetical protein
MNESDTNILPKGYGYHGDFMNGWNIDTLQSAVDTCTNESGRVEDCPIFTPSLQTEAQQGQCDIQKMPAALRNDDCAGPAKGLCGNVPVQYGPGYAAPLEGGSSDAPTAAPIVSSSAIPVPTQSYAPAHSKGAGGISVFNVATSAVAEAVSSILAPVPSPAAPIITPAPAKQAVDDAANGKIVSTTTYTSNGIEYVVAIEEVEVVVTVTDDGAYKRSNKRHAHAKAHQRRHADRRD